MFDALMDVKRPILILGAGVRIGGACDLALRLIEKLQIPVALTWAMQDLLDADHELNVGSFGISASRRGNFAVQNADFILSIGSRLDSHATGTPISSFARGAQKIIVDIDENELAKFSDMPNTSVFCAHAKGYIQMLLENADRAENISEWRTQILEWRAEFPSVLPEWREDGGFVNPYHFLEIISEEAADNAIVIPDCGGNLIQTFQAFKVRAGQRLFSAFNASPMGYSLAGAIGAAFACPDRQIICIIGDGGLQVNLQELGTVMRHKLPIKIFLFNNHGYGIIQQTQEDWLDGRLHGSRPETGLADLNYMDIARAFGMTTMPINNHANMRKLIREALDYRGPILAELDIDPNQRLEPFLKAGRPIEDAQPLLSRGVFLRQMIVEPMEVSKS